MRKKGCSLTWIIIGLACISVKCEATCARSPSVAFAIDVSSAVMTTEFSHEKAFVTSTSQKVFAGASNNAVILYSEREAVLSIDFEAYSSYTKLENAITKLTYQRDTNATALGACLSCLFNLTYQRREPDVLVVLKIVKTGTTARKMNDGHHGNLQKIAVVIGHNWDISKVANFRYSFHVGSPLKLSNIEIEVVGAVCGEPVTSSAEELASTDVAALERQTISPAFASPIPPTPTYQQTTAYSNSRTTKLFTAVSVGLHPNSIVFTYGISSAIPSAPSTITPPSTAGVFPSSPMEATKHSVLVSPSSVNIMFPTTNTHGESNYKDLEKDLNNIINFEKQKLDFDNKTFVKALNGWVLCKKGFIGKAASLLAHSELDQHLRDGSRTGLNVINALERFGARLGQHHHKKLGFSFAYSTQTLEFLTSVVNTSSFMGQQIGNLSSAFSSTFLPRDLFFIQNASYGVIVSMIFNPVQLLKNGKLPNSTLNTTLVGRVVAMTTIPRPHRKLREPVVIKFRHDEVIKAGPRCVFWVDSILNALGGHWSQDGCHAAISNATYTECHCDHMTSYGVLMAPIEQVVPMEQQQALTILSYVGCSFSIVCVFLTTVIFLTLPVLKSDIMKIHLNLAISIGVAQVLFLAADSTNLVRNGIVCKMYAGLMFYFFMSTFTWMFVEGLHLYQLVVIAFVSRSMMRFYYGIGWGLSGCIVVIASSIAHGNFSTAHVCWLSPTGGAIWAFSGPALCITLVNTFVLVGVLRVRVNVDDAADSRTKVKTGARVSVVLLPLLGLTWLFGVLSINSRTLAFQHIFVVCNSIQGVLIFGFHCIGSHEVRREFQRKTSQWQLMRSLSFISSTRVEPFDMNEHQKQSNKEFVKT